MGETATWDNGGLAAESGEGESIAHRSQSWIGVGGTKLLSVTVGLGARITQKEEGIARRPRRE
jgi:hypothetical protein